MRFSTWWAAVCGGATLLVLAGAERGRAGDTYFKVASGDWVVATNWSAGAPTAMNTARIGDSPVGAAVAAAYIHNGDVAVATNVTLGRNAAGNVGTLVIENGASLVLYSSSQLGYTAGATGVVTQTGGTVNQSGGLLYVGYGGVGSRGTYTMNGSGGVLTNVGTLRIGYNGGAGDMGVSNGASVYCSGIDVGNMGLSDGTLTVRDGGVCVVRGAINTALNVARSGRIVVSNATLDASGQTLSLAQSTNSSASLDVGDGTVLVNALTMGTTSNTQASASIYGTGTVSVAGTVNIGYSVGAFAVLTNAGALLRVGTNLNVAGGTGSSGSQGQLFMPGNATADIGGTLDIGVVSSSSGTVVQSAGYCRAGILWVGDTGTGDLYIAGSAVMDVYSNKQLYIGQAAGSRGVLTITNDAVLSCTGRVTVGRYGQGELRINGGKVVVGTDGNFCLSVGDQSTSSGRVTVTAGTLMVTGTVSASTIGQTTAGAWFVLSGGTFSNASALQLGASGTGARGDVQMSGGAWIQERTLTLGLAASSTGTLTMTGGVLTNKGAVTIAQGANSVGTMNLSGSAAWTLTGGNDLIIGNASNAAGNLAVDGVTVTNGGRLVICQQNSFARGRMWVNNGASFVSTGTVFVGSYGDGLLSVSNAAFYGYAAVNVGANGVTATGRVELAGTSRVFAVNTLAVGTGVAYGFVTNHVRAYAGGIDVTNAATGALSVSTNGSRIFLSFEQNPQALGDFWGLRWAGTNHVAALVAFTNATTKKLDWDDSLLSPIYRGQTRIYTNATDTLVGFVVTTILAPARNGTVILLR